MTDDEPLEVTLAEIEAMPLDKIDKIAVKSLRMSKFCTYQNQTVSRRPA